MADISAIRVHVPISSRIFRFSSFLNTSISASWRFKYPAYLASISIASYTYEGISFNSDQIAEIVSRELELTLTGKDCGLEKRAPMCGIPHHAANNYIARLIAEGYKVAICEQLSDPKASKGLVQRCQNSSVVVYTRALI